MSRRKPLSTIRLVSALALAGACALGAASAWATPEPATQAEVEKLSVGLRASRIIGSPVTNEAREWVGEIDDIVIGADGKSPYAVLSVGTYLGLGAHYVAVPCEDLKVDARRITLPGATKEALSALPEFKYAK